MIREAKKDELNLVLEIAHRHAQDAGVAGYDDIDDNHFRQQLKDAVITPSAKLLIVFDNMKPVGYSLSTLDEKIWNGALHGHIMLFYIDKEARNKNIADDLLAMNEDWFRDSGCLFYHASVMLYDENYKPKDEYIRRAKTYFASSMAEVGYSFVKGLK